MFQGTDLYLSAKAGKERRTAHNGCSSNKNWISCGHQITKLS